MCITASLAIYALKVWFGTTCHTEVDVEFAQDGCANIVGLRLNHMLKLSVLVVVKKRSPLLGIEHTSGVRPIGRGVQPRVRDCVPDS